MATSRPGSRGAVRGSAPVLAYALHRWDWSETSLIVELFTRPLGRVTVVAKGAKRPGSALRPVLLPFHPLWVTMSKAATEGAEGILTLKAVEWAGGVPSLPPAALMSAFYTSELVLKLSQRHDPHPALFDAYTTTLVALALQGEDAATLRAFELVLLRELGVLPQLDLATLTTQPLQPAQRYRLHPEAGLVHQASGGLEGQHWTGLEPLLAACREPVADLTPHPMTALRDRCAALPSTERTVLREQLREVLHYHLGSSRLRTRQVWRGVQHLLETSPA